MADETDYTRTFVGARYVPKFEDYSASAVYEPLTMVVVNDNIYISKQFVPAGVAVSNTEYWSMMPAFDTNSEQAIIDAVNNWLAAHPEATTTVQDGSITDAKISNESSIRIYRGTAQANNYNNLLSHITESGIYYIANNELQNFTDRPEGISPNIGNFLFVDKIYQGSSGTYVRQVYFCSRGIIKYRMVMLADYSYITTGITADSNGWFYDQQILAINNTLNEISYYRGIALGNKYDNLLSHITIPGIYYIPAPQNFTDRPEGILATIGNFLIVDKIYQGTSSSFIRQTYFSSRGVIKYRMINLPDYSYITTGITADSNGWFYEQNLNKFLNTLRFLNKNIVFFGDSRTWYDGNAYISSTKEEWRGRTCKGYQQYVKQICSCNVINEGVSGDSSIDICNRIINYDFSTVDAVFLEGGVNDFIHSNITIGEIQPIGSTFDTTTVYGSWQNAIEYIINNYPSVKIYMDVPAIAWKNNNTLFPYSIAEIKKNIAELYNIPCLDLYKNAGVNILNRSYYYADDPSVTGWYLHFNDYGNKLIGEIVAEFINTH